MRVLVVDDDPPVLDSIERALRIEGYTVDAVGAGFPALERQHDDPADAVVLDLRLPDLDGLEVCRRMRAAGDGTAVLMLTAHDAVGERVAGLDAGADEARVGEHSPPTGQVEVAVRDAEIAVRDHGPGIAPEDVPFVFDRFWRAERARGTPGSGLGLAIVRQIADQHHATIEVEAPADGGTRIRLRFPA